MDLLYTKGQSWTGCIASFLLGGAECLVDTVVVVGSLKGHIVSYILDGFVFNKKYKTFL